MIFINAGYQLLTNAKKARKDKPLPPPVSEPKCSLEQGGLPRCGYRNQAIDTSASETADVRGEDKKCDAQADITTNVAEGAKWILLKEMLGDSIMNLF